MNVTRWRSTALLIVAATFAALLSSPDAGAVPPPRPPGCTGNDIAATNFGSQPISGIGTPTITSNLTVAFNTIIRDVDIRTDITHAFPGDLDMTLTSPAGTTVTLTSDNASTNDNVFDGTVWDDQANPAGQVPYTDNNGLVTDHDYMNNVPVPTLAPEEPLAAFNGEEAGGTWTLTVSDDANSDGGTLDGWRLDFDQPTTVEPATSSVFQVNDNNRAIPAGPAVVTSDITVSGAGTYLTDSNLITGIEHTRPRDLDVTLRSPAGTVATLTTDNGGNDDDVFDGVVWDDSANPGGVAPFANNGTASDRDYVPGVAASPTTPEESFGVFIGENPNGVWRLTISDDEATEAGLLDGWGLLVKSGYCGSPTADGRIKKGAGGPLAGDGVYNTTGVDQTRTGAKPRGATQTYFISGQNDSSFTDRLRFRGKGSNNQFLVTYRSPGGANITNQVIHAGHLSPPLTTGSTYQIRVDVKVRNTAPAGATLTRSLNVSSGVDPGDRDTVKFVTSRA